MRARDLWLRFYGVVGFLLLAFMFAAGLAGIPYLSTWVTPVAWYGYILFFDWLVYARQKRSLIRNRFGEFLRMLPLSVVLWGIFELHNLQFHNWEYVGLPEPGWLAAVGFLVSFATILPALYETKEFFQCYGWFDVRIPPGHYAPSRLRVEMFLGLLALAVAVIFPSVYTGPLIWLGYFFVVLPLNYLWRIPDTVLLEREEGRLQDFLCLMAAGYVCGFVWEGLNYWAGARWVYHVPYLESIKIFEMPVLGFLAFGPFAVTFVEMYRLLDGWKKRRLGGAFP